MRSPCRSGLRPALPEVLESTAELHAAQRNDGVGAGDGPMHAGALEARADGQLAACLDDTGGGAKPLGAKLVVAHSGSIVLKVVDALSGYLGALGVQGEGGDDLIDLSGIEFLVALASPLRQAL